MDVGRVNIGAGRRAIRSATEGGSVDPGLAEPYYREGEGEDNVTSHGRRPIPMKTVNTDGRAVGIPHAGREVPPVVEDHALAIFLGGTKSAAEVERSLGLRTGYLGIALRRRYGDVNTLKRALQGSLLESSLVMVEHAMLNVTEMSPAQAMLGAKIAVDASNTLEKSMREAPKTIDFSQLSELGEGLSRIQAYITGAGGAVGSEGLEIRSNEDEITRD